MTKLMISRQALLHFPPRSASQSGRRLGGLSRWELASSSSFLSWLSSPLFLSWSSSSSSSRSSFLSWSQQSPQSSKSIWKHLQPGRDQLLPWDWGKLTIIATDEDVNVGDDDDDDANVVDGDVVWFSRYRESTRGVSTAPRGRREDNCRWPPPFLGDHTDGGGKYGEDITLMMMTMRKMVVMMMMSVMIITTRWLFTTLSQHKGLGWELWRIGSTRRKVEVFSLECFFAFSSLEFFFVAAVWLFFHWSFPPGNCAFCLFTFVTFLSESYALGMVVSRPTRWSLWYCYLVF